MLGDIFSTILLFFIVVGFCIWVGRGLRAGGRAGARAVTREVRRTLDDPRSYPRR